MAQERAYFEDQLLEKLCDRAGLSDVEREVVRLYSALNSGTKIASRLKMPPSTVYRHLTAAREKMGATAKAIAQERVDGRSELEEILEMVNPNPRTPIFVENDYTGELERLRLHSKV